MTPEQIKTIIQEKFHTALYQKTFLGKDRAAKDALNTRIKNGKWFGKFFHTFLSVLEACGLEISPGWVSVEDGSPEIGQMIRVKGNVMRYCSIVGEVEYTSKAVELYEFGELPWYLESDGFCVDETHWKPLDKNHR